MGPGMLEGKPVDVSIEAADREVALALLRLSADADAETLARPFADGQATLVDTAPKDDESAVDAGPSTSSTPVIEHDESCVYLPLSLRHPLTVDGLYVATVALNPPSFSDVEAVIRGDLSEIEMHANMAGLPVAVLRAMRWTDVELVTFMARRLAPEFGAR